MSSLLVAVVVVGQLSGRSTMETNKAFVVVVVGTVGRPQFPKDEAHWPRVHEPDELTKLGELC